jgi:hypothetical protein
MVLICDDIGGSGDSSRATTTATPTTSSSVKRKLDTSSSPVKSKPAAGGKTNSIQHQKNRKRAIVFIYNGMNE